jgi:general secretion pathway protein E
MNQVSDWSGKLDPQAASLLAYPFAKRHGVLVAVRDHGNFQVLCSRAPDLSLWRELRRRLGAPLTLHQVEASQFEQLLRQAYDRAQSDAAQIAGNLGEEFDLEKLAHELPKATDLLEAADEAPVIRLVNALLTQAIRENASDIHLEAHESRSVVRLRVDGVLRDIVEPQRALHAALVSRVKIMANLDIAEKRLPQDGRISVRIGEHSFDIRVSCLPTQHGERVVLRLLEKNSARLDIGQLGMNPRLRERFDNLIRRPHGIILVTGPTGSGKTTTLYAGLLRLDRARLNILTVEDPVEYDLPGIGQMQVNPRIGLTFASGLRSILRQDPDVILVGEIRDLETADIAIQASLTGHLVLATLHTNTAVGAVTRLVDMGVEAFLVSSSLLGVLSQRLVRRLCTHCREPYAPTESERALLDLPAGHAATLYRAVGCAACDRTGYRGRTGIYELVVVDDSMRALIHERASEAELLRAARRHAPALARDGHDKVLTGETSLEEVLRVSAEA